MARLPQPGGDNGSWGDILNDFLAQAHNADGTLKPLSQSQITNLTSALAAKANDADLAAVAKTGSYSELADKPTAADIGAVPSSDLDAATAGLVDDVTSATSEALDAAYERRIHVLRTTWESNFRVDQPPVMATPPTITFTAATGATTIASGMSVPFLLAPNAPALDPRFGHRGAPLANRATSGFQGTVAQSLSGSGGGGTPIAGGSAYLHSVEFIFDGSAFEFIAFADGTEWAYRLWVDGVPKATRGETQAGSNGNDNRLKVDFGSRAQRLIRIDHFRSVGPIKVWIGPQDSISPAPPRSGKILIFGDSFADAANNVNALNVYSMTLVNLLGAGDYYIDGQGSTGFTSPGSAPKTVYLNRINLVPDNWTPDVILLQGSTNDGGSPNITTAAQTAIARCRARWPDAVLALTGLILPQASSSFSAGNQANNAALTALAPSVDIFIDPVAKGWFSGTGWVGATTGIGNADIYRSSDSVHPTQAGHDYIAARIAHDLMAGLATLAP